MKFLVLSACLAVSSAAPSFYGLVAHPNGAAVAAVGGSAGALNLNTHLVAHPNGAVVPADEPAVVAARADHLAAKGVVASAAYAPAVVAAPIAAHGGLVAHPNGAVVPVDEPAVAAARADHLAALAHGY